MMKSNFNKTPFVPITGNQNCYVGWKQIGTEIKSVLDNVPRNKKVLAVECYHGVDELEILNGLEKHLGPVRIIRSSEAFKTEAEISKMVFADVTDDRIFGRITELGLNSYFDRGKTENLRRAIDRISNGTVLVIGIGASLLVENHDGLVYADMARWEIQTRMRRKEVDNIGLANRETDFMRLYKQGYFVDWRICDSLKADLFGKIDFVLDTHTKNQPKMVSGETMIEGMEAALKRPFSVVPFFDPGPWGGQWMKKVFDLDKDKPNYAWCFNCVPEENSLLLKINDTLIEMPSINLVLYAPEKVLGKKVYERFGPEFPIRFDLLDTMQGGNLSFQVHPSTSYIKEHFNMDYTQDESYYMLDVGENALIYLGVKEGVAPQELIGDLKRAQEENQTFDAEKYVATFPVKKHDHISIPAGTVHCSGKNSMVLEISATPYIFTFKLWDWGRLGMDGKPRPINLAHGEKNIEWNRTTQWVKGNLIDQVEPMEEGEGWREERTGLHKSQFIETRRHWFSSKVKHSTGGTVNVLSLVEGREVLVESPDHLFEPFAVHYAETFIVPASVEEYTIRPYGESEGLEVATLKAYVRSR
ncbi:class I mannose-6-phosphate isomerase [Zobellia galactanivorans]|uniref:Sugar-phosphate isomerase n=1 Tax=Zobellia galactanivorans (strain DSM 12802 / CCUG 47099 / CIP 106680 / NCIMB 13871 / Dsij) TaxID=63186 RepID=G0LCC5_ZOBGA|nr:class I mannose-6-phosphate isomerase [Zobellia galactanivorans]CAZ96827.1 Sugar-phosphate isomerase [Zobellia galactanivorans]